MSAVPVTTSPATAAPLPTRRTVGRALRVFALLALMLSGLITVLLFGVELGSVGLVTGLVVAALPVPVYVALALFIDRFEPEPVRLLAWAFFWGALAATLIAYILNSTGQLIVGAEFGSDVGEIFGATVSAPVVEESAKAVVLVAIYRWRREELNGVLDGLVYAAMVGLGFATTENVLYYGRAAIEGDVPVEAVFIIRGIFSPFAHPVFTAMTGIGLGLAAVRGGASRFLPVVGLLAAIGLHSLWNASASVGDGTAFLGAYLLVMVPTFFALIVVAVVARRRESNMIHRFLQPEVQAGVLTPGEAASLANTKARRRALKEAKRSGRAAHAARRELTDTVTDLAFVRRRIEHRPERPDPHDVAVEGALVQRLGAVQGASGRTPALPASITPPGWYPDPSAQARLRWWDGRAWTAHVAA